MLSCVSVRSLSIALNLCDAMTGSGRFGGGMELESMRSLSADNTAGAYISKMIIEWLAFSSWSWYRGEESNLSFPSYYGRSGVFNRYTTTACLIRSVVLAVFQTYTCKRLVF